MCRVRVNFFPPSGRKFRAAAPYRPFSGPGSRNGPHVLHLSLRAVRQKKAHVEQVRRPPVHQPRGVDRSVREVKDLFGKYRLSEALMAVYKLFWDEFSSWYLEMIKPGYQQPIDRTTYDATLCYFDSLLRLLHPFMPFITEELWQHLYERKEGESIMTARIPDPKPFDNEIINRFETTKQIVAGIRTVRLQKGIANKEPLTLQIIGSHDPANDCILAKMTNLETIEAIEEKDPAAASFRVHATEYAIPMGNNIDVETELKKLEGELKYAQGFLKTVMGKLSNERFVQNAPEAVVAMERKKKADAEEKIKSLEESIAALKK